MINIALVGHGRWGKNYVGAITAAKGRLSWIHTRSGQIGQVDLPENCRVSTNYSDLLEDPNLHAVIIATPGPTHYQLAKLALEHGKDVLIEKPMVLERRQAQTLASLAKDKRRILMVGHIFLYHPAVLKLKELMAKKELGQTIRYIYSRRTGPGPVGTGIDALWNLAPHDISIANFLLGRSPKRVWGRDLSLSPRMRGDSFTAILDYGRTQVICHLSQIEPVKTREIMIVGDKKTAIFDDMSEQKIRVYSHDNPTEPSYLEIDSTQSPLERQVAHFLDCVTTRQKPVTGAADGVSNVNILSHLQRAVERNNWQKITVR